MQIFVENDYQAMSLQAAKIVANEMNLNPGLVLGLATGSTPLGMYRNWIEMVKSKQLSFANVVTFNLDEYLGLPAEHPQSYASFMQDQLFSQIDIPADHTHIPSGMAKDLAVYCDEFEELITQAGGIDIQILGIGHNGHIGFNEPGTDLGKNTHIVTLSEQTRQANARFFASPDKVPTHAITMGLKSIMNARKIILLASGADKSAAVLQAVSGPVTANLPASILQLHPNCILVLDKAAAAKLPADERVIQGERS